MGSEDVLALLASARILAKDHSAQSSIVGFGALVGWRGV
jgi:hypothetical protein